MDSWMFGGGAVAVRGSGLGLRVIVSPLCCISCDRGFDQLLLWTANIHTTSTSLFSHLFDVSVFRQAFFPFRFHMWNFQERTTQIPMTLWGPLPLPSRWPLVKPGISGTVR